jgi:hypothetical protein
MMSISPSNPIINQILKGCLTKYVSYLVLIYNRDVFIIETAYDYDNCIYFIKREEGADIIKFAFKCNCSK